MTKDGRSPPGGTCFPGPRIALLRSMSSIDRHFTREVVALDASAECREAARLMAEKNIGAVAVKEGGRVVGVVTERDLVYNVLAEGGRCEERIADAMRRDLPCIPPSASEAECADLMRVHFTRHLLVSDESGIVGIISMGDVIRLMLEEKQWLGDVLLKVQRPSAQELDSIPESVAVVAYSLQSRGDAELAERLMRRRISALSLDLLPRIARAQSMDVLSSMANIAGYKSVLIAANALGKFFPMLMTAAGTVLPAKVFVLGDRKSTRLNSSHLVIS